MLVEVVAPCGLATSQAINLADPGMLHSGPGGPQPMAAKSFVMDAGGGPQLRMTPEDIVICVEIDAKFVTD